MFYLFLCVALSLLLHVVTHIFPQFLHEPTEEQVKHVVFVIVSGFYFWTTWKFYDSEQPEKEMYENQLYTLSFFIFVFGPLPYLIMALY